MGGFSRRRCSRCPSCSSLARLTPLYILQENEAEVARMIRLPDSPCIATHSGSDWALMAFGEVKPVCPNNLSLVRSSARDRLKLAGTH